MSIDRLLPSAVHTFKTNNQLLLGGWQLLTKQRPLSSDSLCILRYLASQPIFCEHCASQNSNLNVVLLILSLTDNLEAEMFPESTDASHSNAEKRKLSTKPVLKSSTIQKISMLPEPRRRRREREITPPVWSQHGQYDTSMLRLDQSYQLSQPNFGADPIAEPSEAKMGYKTCNDTTTHLNLYACEEDTEKPKMPNFRTDHGYQTPDNILSADVSLYKGETTSVELPGAYNDVLQSRLQGLRTFRGWSARARENAQRHEQFISKKRLENSTVLLHNTRSIEAIEKRRLKYYPPLHHGFKTTKTRIGVPTPFPSPQVTQVPPSTNHPDHVRCLISPPNLDLRDAISAGVALHAGPQIHSRTAVAPDDCGHSQSVSKPRFGSSTGSNSWIAARAGSRSQTRPPQSFPRDFYERFPHAEDLIPNNVEDSVDTARSQQPIRRVLSKTPPVPAQLHELIASNIEPTAMSGDRQRRTTFYTTIHYFTGCPHASPPANRPLDPEAQPRPDPNCRPSKPELAHSIIPGACFHCDLDQRRMKEDEIIKVNTGSIALLAAELAEMLDEFELTGSDEEGVAEYLCDKSPGSRCQRSTCDEDDIDPDLEAGRIKVPQQSSHNPKAPIALRSRKSQKAKPNILDRLSGRIRDLEARIDEVRYEQDEQIKGVWLGFTPRWGPATLGVQRGRTGMDAHQDLAARTSSTPISQNSGNVLNETGHIQIRELKTNQSKKPVGTPGNGGSNTYNRSTSEGRSEISSSKSGISETPSSAVSARDVPGSRSPGEGKMRVGWIREDR